MEGGTGSHLQCSSPSSWWRDGWDSCRNTSYKSIKDYHTKLFLSTSFPDFSFSMFQWCLVLLKLLNMTLLLAPLNRSISSWYFFLSRVSTIYISETGTRRQPVNQLIVHRGSCDPRLALDMQLYSSDFGRPTQKHAPGSGSCSVHRHSSVFTPVACPKLTVRVHLGADMVLYTTCLAIRRPTI